MGTSNDAIVRLYQDAHKLIWDFSETNAEIQKVGDADPRAPDLKGRLETLRARVRYLQGVLGVHSPDVSPTLGELIWPDGITTSEYRQKYLTLKDVFGALAEGLQRKPSAREFYSFVIHLNIHELRDAPEIAEADVERLIAGWPERNGLPRISPSRP
jgi:hypothetical protein